MENLMNKRKKVTSFANSVWLQLFCSFFKDPSNNRSCPGKEQVNVGFKNWQPKFLLQDSKKNIITKFLNEATDKDGKKMSLFFQLSLQTFP